MVYKWQKRIEKGVKVQEEYVELNLMQKKAAHYHLMQVKFIQLLFNYINIRNFMN